MHGVFAIFAIFVVVIFVVRIPQDSGSLFDVHTYRATAAAFSTTSHGRPGLPKWP